MSLLQLSGPYPRSEIPDTAKGVVLTEPIGYMITSGGGPPTRICA